MQTNILNVKISGCTESEFPIVKKLITELCLDDNDLQASQFLVAKFEDKIVGFGRLRQYPACNELCSLGVIEDQRLKGVGRQLSLALIKKATLPLYLVAIIPDFFSKFGFTEITDFPSELGVKLKYCRESLSVPEPYVVMKLI
jgi:N-acetylglutamate synthase-like GNAT family acetyltransferase